MTTTISKKSLWIKIAILLQALIATLGSLYYSTFGEPVENIMNGNLFPEDMGFVPCELCWFARILMYPIVILTLVGIITKDNKFTNYILPLALPGVILEAYHYVLQKAPVENLFSCTAFNPCSALNVNYFGFLTIPLLCLIAFIVITILSIWHRQVIKRGAIS